MRSAIFLLLIFIAGISAGCSGSHAIQCTSVNEQKICFIREVWGFNGESLSLTTNDNVCYKPTNKKDYISNRMRGGDVIYAKITNGKFYVHSVPLTAPENQFPIEVISESYNPMTDFDRDFVKDDYQKFDLGSKNMTWCFSDIF